MKNKITALYCRFSRDEHSENDSNSIANQKILLEDYAVKNGFSDYEFFADDGYTGTNFNRPVITDLFSRIEKDEVSTVIVKDMSRFGRNYLMVGYYKEVYFSEKDIRFISVNDNIDTGLGIDNELSPFLNIMNELYARDTSKKLRVHFKVKGESKTLTSNPPYGYVKNSDGSWSIDEYAAKIVRQIFELYINGERIVDICDLLKSQKVLIPALYKRDVLRIKCASGEIKSDMCGWNNKAITRILTNQAYVGDAVNFRTHRKSYKDKKTIHSPEDKWYILENNHPAIISRDAFDVVQNMKKSKRCKKHHIDFNDVFYGLVYCYDCKGKMYVRRYEQTEKNFYICSTYAGYRKCSNHRVNVKDLKIKILSDLKRFVELDEADVLKKALKQSVEVNDVKSITELKRKAVALESELDDYNTIIKSMYADKVRGNLTLKQFNDLYCGYVSDMTQCENEISEIKKQLSVSRQHSADIDNFLKALRKHKEEIVEDKLTEICTNRLIDRIYVREAVGKGKDRTQVLDIFWKGIGMFDFHI